MGEKRTLFLKAPSRRTGLPPQQKSGHRWNLFHDRILLEDIRFQDNGNRQLPVSYEKIKAIWRTGSRTLLLRRALQENGLTAEEDIILNTGVENSPTLIG